MPKKWDDMLKRMFAAHPEDFIHWLLPFAVLLSKVPLELKTLTRTINSDSLYRILIDGKEALIHIEFQRRPQPKMVERLWEYNVLATLEYGCPVYSFVIYLTKGGKVLEPPMMKGLERFEPIHIFRYWNIKLWELEVDTLKNADLPGILPLCLLAQGGNQRQVAEMVFENVIHDTDLLGLSLMFASLVFNKTNDEEWLERKILMLDDLLSDSPYYQRLVRKGEEKGEEKGVRRTLRELTLAAIEKRFPDLAASAKQRVNHLQDVNLLRQLFDQIIDAQSREEAERALSEIGEHKKTRSKA